MKIQIPNLRNLLTQFKQDYSRYYTTTDPSYAYWYRDNCGLAASDFVTWLKQRDIQATKVNGIFYADVPVYQKNDFDFSDLNYMESQGFNYNSSKQRRAFLDSDSRFFELNKYIPHIWVSINNQIVDPSGYEQFIKTKLASDLDKSRYIAVSDTDKFYAKKKKELGIKI